MDEEQIEQIKNENELVKIERKKLVAPTAKLVSDFKKNFLSAPIRRAFKASLEGK